MQISDALIDRFLDGDVSEEESTQVLAWLEMDGSLDEFAARAELHAELRRSLRRRQLQEEALAGCEEFQQDRSSSQHTGNSADLERSWGNGNYRAETGAEMGVTRRLQHLAQEDNQSSTPMESSEIVSGAA